MEFVFGRERRRPFRTLWAKTLNFLKKGIFGGWQGIITKCRLTFSGIGEMLKKISRVCNAVALNFVQM